MKGKQTSLSYDPDGPESNSFGKPNEKKVPYEGRTRQVIGPEKRLRPC